MKTAIGHLLGSLISAQTGPAASAETNSSLVILLGVGIGTATVVAIWTFMQWRSSRQRLAALTIEHKTTTEAHRTLLDKERKQAKTLDGKRDNLKDVKRDLASQKKKNHKIQEELKTMRAELRDHLQDAEKKRNSRPAFDVSPTAKEPVAETKKAAEPEEKPEEVKNVPAPKPDPARVDAAVQRLEEELEAERATSQKQRAELKRLRRRSEDLGRVDMITKGQIAVLDDKVRTLGRQYYDAVSEVAALKGEVQPPKPRDQQPAKAMADSGKPPDDEPADGEASANGELQPVAAQTTDETSDRAPEARG